MKMIQSAAFILLAVVLTSPRAVAEDSINLFETLKWSCFAWNNGQRGDKAGEWVDEPVKVGPRVFRWSAFMEPLNDFTSLRQVLDLSGYDTFHFWMHSAKATGQKIMFSARADSQDEGVAVGFYQYKIVVDWEEWKEFNIPFDGMKPFHHPKDWNEIKSVSFEAGGWGGKPLPETVLTIDDLKAVKSGASDSKSSETK